MATKEMFVGDTDIISVDFNPVNATNQNLRWYTSDENVVPPIETDQILYTVKAGDTLYSIANKYGISLNELKAINNLENEKNNYFNDTRLPKGYFTPVST